MFNEVNGAKMLTVSIVLPQEVNNMGVNLI